MKVEVAVVSDADGRPTGPTQIITEHELMSILKIALNEIVQIAF